MKCPYSRIQATIQGGSTGYDENGNQTSWADACITTTQFNECMQQECSAFYNGRCHYNNQ